MAEQDAPKAQRAEQDAPAGEVARGAAAQPAFALARKPDASAVLDAGGHLHGEAPLLGDPAIAAAARTGSVDHLAHAAASPAG